MTDADALLREIVANPARDVLRLAYADAIEERRRPGDEAFAEFVRAQIRIAQLETGCPNSIRQPTYDRDEYIALQSRERELWPAVRPVFEGGGVVPYLDSNLDWPVARSLPYVIMLRGFPAVARCTLAEWQGGACDACMDDAGPGRTYTRISGCTLCHGTGHIPGIGPRLAQRWPVEKVETDRKPNSVPFNGRCGWFCPVTNYLSGHPSWLPKSVFDLLEGGEKSTVDDYPDQPMRWYDSESAALAALSEALLAEARTQPSEVTT